MLNLAGGFGVEMQFTGKYNGFGRVLPQSNTKERSRTFLHYHVQLQTLVRQSPSGLRSKAQSNHTSAAQFSFLPDCTHRRQGGFQEGAPQVQMLVLKASVLQ